MAKIIKRETDSTTTSTSVGTGAFSLGGARTYSIQSNVSTAGSGSVKIQATNVGADDRVEGDWQDITGTTATVSGDTKTLYDVTDADYEFFRLYFTVDSGTFTTTNYIVIKD